MVEYSPPPRTRHHACAVAPLGRSHHQGLAPRLWWIRAALWQTFRLSRGRYRLFFWLPGDWTAAGAGTGAVADRGLQPTPVPQRPHQPGGRDASLPRSECALDGPDALRNVPAVA